MQDLHHPTCQSRCTILGELTRSMFRRRFRPKGSPDMSIDATKKSPPVKLHELQLEYQIRQRAYELYEARGREDGHELEDWLRAEEEITGKRVRTVAA